MKAPDPKPASALRRRLLLSAVSAGSLLLPASLASWAQSEGAVKLLRTPKRALVIGNAAYRSEGALRNPVNDADAVSAALQAFGFEVARRLDATR